ncbi:phage replisome organizer N-terminal domain-containing protein [Thiotrichales bacterium 19S9-12]|nr:phage replisome organizer N-terminal domain-containing protein [Thiotrichales bacterium 19S9-11]MCF6812540.1 phage replisome organizer N-terminal domain-containing protein [Thiotrichales bacterium 19S9-12]
MNKRYFWLKLKEGFFSEPKIKKLRKIAGGDTYTIIFQKIMLLSIKNQGFIYFEGLEKDFSSELSLILDEDDDNVEVTLEYMLRTGLLDEVESNKYLVTNVIDLIGSETQSTIRARNLRAKKLNKCQPEALQCNADATLMQRQCNKNATPEKEIDIDKSKEIEKRKNIQKEKTIFDLIDLSLHKLFEEFLNVRTQLKANNTDRVINLIVNELNKHPLNEQKQMLENSIINSWKSVYPIKNHGKQENKYNSSVNKVFDDAWSYSDDELLKHNEAVMGEIFNTQGRSYDD